MKKWLLSLFLLLASGPSVYAAETVIALPDNLTDLPILTTQIGSDAVACYTGNNQSRQWVIGQWKNEQSLCLDTNNAPFDAECQGADLARETITERACYWSSQKKFHATVNNTNFSGSGCGANSGTLGNEPGGYGISLLSGISSRPDWRSSYSNYTLENLDKLLISATVSIDYVNDQLGQCSQPCDPVAQSCDPITFFGMNVITHKFDSAVDAWQGSQFYNVGLYDNRPALANPNVLIQNCKLPTTSGAGTFVNLGQPVTYYGLPFVYPGQGSKFYEIDVLPQLKKYISACELQLTGNSNPDWNHYMVDGAFFANEAYNKVIMSYTIMDPKIRLVYKPGYSSNSTPSPTPTPPTGGSLQGDINSDGKVDIFDYNLLVSDFGKTGAVGFTKADLDTNGKVDIFDYNILVSNFGKTQ